MGQELILQGHWGEDKSYAVAVGITFSFKKKLLYFSFCKADNFFQSSCWNFNLDLIVSGFLLFVNIPTSSL